MAGIQNTGTLITSAIRPNNSADLIASAFANEIKGGHHGYATLVERDLIIAERREWGMFATVYADGTASNNNTYQLTYGYSDTVITNNSNWVVFGGSLSGVFVTSSTIAFTAGFTVSADVINYSLTPNHLNDVGGATAGYVLSNDGSGNFIWVPQTAGTGSGGTGSVNFGTSSTIQFNTIGSTTSATIIPNSITASLLSTVDGGATAGYVLANDGLGNFTWVESIQSLQPTTTNYTISATGTDAYYGTASPTLFTYSSSDMYLVDFANTNTGLTAVTLNIDGLGAYEVISFDDNGPIGLTGGGEITPGQVYYVIFDGANFQISIQNPNSNSPLTYTSNVGSIAVGGIAAGTTFSEATMKQMWDALLKPTYLNPNFTSFNTSPVWMSGGSPGREVGATISAGTYSFVWSTSFPANVSPNTIIIKNGASVLISATANDGIAAVNHPVVNRTAAGSNTWGIYATRTSSVVISSAFSIFWYWRRFYGATSSATLTESQIHNTFTTAPWSALSTSRVGTYAFGAGGYKYFIWPSAFGEAILFRDYNTNLAVAMAGTASGYTQSIIGPYYHQNVSITNVNGITTNYYVYRTLNVLGGSINIVVT